MRNRKEYSQKTSKAIDRQIISIANNAINHAMKILSDKLPLMDTLVDELMVNETLESEYIVSSLNAYLSAKL